MRKAVNIIWDYDEELDDEIVLPFQVYIPDDIDDEHISDYLSDTFGFCVIGLEVAEGVDYTIKAGGSVPITSEEDYKKVWSCSACDKDGKPNTFLIISDTFEGADIIASDFFARYSISEYDLDPLDSVWDYEEYKHKFDEYLADKPDKIGKYTLEPYTVLV